jgi:hypothetical protein
MEEATQVVANFPTAENAPLRIIISGGEPLVNRRLLYLCLDKLYDRYGNAPQYMLQTNGDLLTDTIMGELLEHHITRIDIASIDRYHKAKGERATVLKLLMEAHGMVHDDDGALVSLTHLTTHELSFAMWGANENFWIGGNWARGRGYEKNIYLKDPLHNFCAITSGAKGFAGLAGTPEEIAIQLYHLYPCCPGTRMAIADLRVEPLTDAINRVKSHPMWQALNTGDAWKMGLYKGVSEDYAKARTAALGNVCLWCDEFFEKFYEAFEANSNEAHQNLHRAPSQVFVQIALPNLPS